MHTTYCFVYAVCFVCSKVSQRQRVMLNYQKLIRDHTPELAELITREQGKTIADAKGDIFRGVEVVEFACMYRPVFTNSSAV